MACLKNAGWFPGPGARPTQARGSPGVGACEETERSKRQIGARLLCTFASVSPSSGSPPAQPSRQSRRVDRPRRGAAAVQWRRQWRCDPSQRRQKANLAPSPSLSLRSCHARTHACPVASTSLAGIRRWQWQVPIQASLPRVIII